MMIFEKEMNFNWNNVKIIERKKDKRTEGRYEIYMCNELFDFLMFGKFLIYIFMKLLVTSSYI